MISWINQQFGLHLTAIEVQHIRDFSLIWNIFEGIVCKTNFSIDRVEASFVQQHFNASDFQPFFEYFRGRYVSDGRISERFQYLNFRSSDRKEMVIKTLLNQSSSIKDQVLAMVIIVFRFRNNLFHGLKAIRQIDEQNENFAQANGLLKTLVEYYI